MTASKTPRPLRVGFLGCDAIAEAHLRELAKFSGVRVVAYWNRTHARAERLLKEFGGEYAAEDFHRIAEDLSLDAVYINTMHNDRLCLVEAVAGTGKPIFSEKPLAHDAVSLRALHSIVNRHRARFWSGVKIRFHTLIEKARELMPRPEALTAHVMDETWMEGHLNDPAVCGGGDVLAQRAYATEFVRVLAEGMPVAVTAMFCSDRHKGGAPDTLCAAFQFDTGALASVAIADAGGSLRQREQVPRHGVRRELRNGAHGPLPAVGHPRWRPQRGNLSPRRGWVPAAVRGLPGCRARRGPMDDGLP